MDKQYLDHPVFKSIQPASSNRDLFGDGGEILFSNGLEGLPSVKNLPEDLQTILENNLHINGTNLFSQLNTAFKEVEGGPWYIDSLNGILFIHNENFEDTPFTTYTYQYENGEVLSVTFGLRPKYNGPVSGNVKSNTRRIPKENPYEGKLKKAIAERENPPENNEIRYETTQIVDADQVSATTLNSTYSRPDLLKSQMRLENKDPEYQKQKQANDSLNSVRNKFFQGNFGDYASLSKKDPGGTNLNLSQAVKSNPELMTKLKENIEKDPKLAETVNTYEVELMQDILSGKVNSVEDATSALAERHKGVDEPVTLKSNGLNFDTNGEVTRSIWDVTPDMLGLDGMNATNDQVLKAIEQTHKGGTHESYRVTGVVLENNGQRNFLPNGAKASGKPVAWRVEVRSGERTNQITTDLKNIVAQRVYYSPEAQGFIHQQKQINALKGALNALVNGLTKRREMELTCTLKVVGKPSLTNFMTLEIWNVGKRWSGKWYVKSCTHSMSPNEGYITTLEMVKR